MSKEELKKITDNIENDEISFFSKIVVAWNHGPKTTKGTSL